LEKGKDHTQSLEQPVKSATFIVVSGMIACDGSKSANRLFIDFENGIGEPVVRGFWDLKCLSKNM
jgi:hypothetical protein